MSQSKIVLSLCDLSTIMLWPWAQAGGFRCIAVDIKHKRNRINGKGIECVRADIRGYEPPPGEYAACFAFPPCTHLARSGARWWEIKGHAALNEGLELVNACREIQARLAVPCFIENPIGRLTENWRRWNYRFHPWEYGGYLNPPGEAYTKATCLWTDHGFKMPERKPVPREMVRDYAVLSHGMSSRRAKKRSQTPLGFAIAVFEANRA